MASNPDFSVLKDFRIESVVASNHEAGARVLVLIELGDVERRFFLSAGQVAALVEDLTK